MIERAQDRDASQIAQLHLQSISEGFLSKLGVDFLVSLYSYLISKEIVYVFKKDSKVVGFVSCSLRASGIMRKFIFSRPSCLYLLGRLLIGRPRLMIPLFETLSVPSKMGKNKVIQLPTTELLSISVDSSFRNTNIGSQLIYALEHHLKTFDIKNYKVVAGASLAGANNFYMKNGFILATQIKIHSKALSNVYLKVL